jgi:DNA invertase Pin-like site-specific DNA recombinase
MQGITTIPAMGTATNITVASTIAAIPASYCLYARKSTEQDERQALSIDSQIKEMLELANRDGLNVTEVRKESYSAKDSGQRPVFNSIIADIRSGKFNSILTWAPDRCSRNAGDLGVLVDLMDQGLLKEIRTHGQRFSNNPNEKFLLMILCSQAKLENDNKSLNVKRGLRAKLELGLWPGTAPTGYLNEYRTDRKGHLLVDHQRAPIIRQMFEKVGNQSLSGRQVYIWLKETDFKTKGGKHLSLSNIYLILKNSFYSGVVEYPVGSGKWYTGKHTPLISKELFEKVQERLTRDHVVRVSKEFAFTKLMTCGVCGSGISAEEKHKVYKNGTEKTYVYYGCCRSKSREKSCGSGYIQEGELVSQLAKIIDQIDINELGMKAKLEEEIKRAKYLQTTVLGMEAKAEDPDIEQVDVRTYAKHIIKHGSLIDKRELLGCLKTKLFLTHKVLSLQK